MLNLRRDPSRHSVRTVQSTLSLRVAIDASTVMLEAVSGIKRYVMALLPELANLDPGLDITAWMGFLNPVHDEGLPLWDAPNLQNRVLRLPRRWIESAWSRGLLPVEQITPEVDIFHSLWMHLPPARKCRRILTIHDLRDLVFPRMYSNVMERNRELLTRNIDASDLVVVISHATAADLRHQFGNLNGKSIEVVHNGVNSYFCPQPGEKVAQTLRKFCVDRPYVLSIGSGDPRKNMPRLIEAFAQYVQETRDDLRLVITGVKHPSYAAAFAQVEQMGLSDAITYVGVVSDSDWRNLLCGAEALIYPSLYEGFGLPPLEAMACGTPVLASAIPPLMEVAGEAAHFFDPNETESILVALAEFRSSPAIADRLRRAGPGRAAQFTWDRVARDYLRIYEQVSCR
jgi:glycosyltransferase involved in cell wall biosynthesis